MGLQAQSLQGEACSSGKKCNCPKYFCCHHTISILFLTSDNFHSPVGRQRWWWSWEALISAISTHFPRVTLSHHTLSSGHSHIVKVCHFHTLTVSHILTIVYCITVAQCVTFSPYNIAVWHRVTLSFHTLSSGHIVTFSHHNVAVSQCVTLSPNISVFTLCNIELESVIAMLFSIAVQCVKLQYTLFPSLSSVSFLGWLLIHWVSHISTSCCCYK